MVIGFNALPYKHALTKEQWDFISQLISELSKKYPEHSFHLIHNEALNENVTAINVKTTIVPVRTSLIGVSRQKLHLSKLVKKVKANVVVSVNDGCLSGLNLPQCLLVDDFAFLQKSKSDKVGSLISTRRMAGCFAKAATIATTAGHYKKEIEERYKVPLTKIKILYKPANKLYTPLNESLRSEIKEKYTAGTEYFIYLGLIHPKKNLINLLKAFSLFKKRQKTSMKLVLAGPLEWEREAFLKLLQTYKYRDDVVWPEEAGADEQRKLLGAAYAFIYPTGYNMYQTPLLEALQCHVPALVAAGAVMQEIAKEAALYFDQDQTSDIADKMMWMYKDENLRSRLIENGKLLVANYTLQQAADVLWQCITEAAK